MKGRGIVNHSSRFFHFMIWVLIFTFFLPTPVLMTAQAGENPDTAYVMRRFNSPERARAIEEAARQDAAVRAAYAEQEAAAASSATAPPAASAPKPEQQQTAAAGQRPADAFRPKTLTEVLFNQGAAFMGVPGLAPQQDKYGHFDEGLGFHQDGTVRRAGGENSASGYGGKRAASYATYGMTGGMGYGPGGMQGIGYGPYGNGLYDAMHQELWGRDDPTRGGRITNGMGRSFDNFDPMDAAMQKGLNYGLGFLNSAGESALSGLVDGGRARLNFSVDWDGRINGEGDVLLPFWDSQYTTIYTQLGARSMSGMQHGGDDGEGADRWIGNAGLGQRWFPFAEDINNAGNLMLGYNAFFDYDFTRSHQRGGFGVEAQYDWLRLASNYYFPISSWRDSKDFDGDFVKERAAEGWDVRVKGYMPFYRNLAVTGAYSQWYGDHVGMFSSSKLEKDPKVWSYGLEYTPVPLVSGFVNQRSTENGRSDTEFGLRFTYHFQMPWEDQVSHAKVAELRTVSGSKHEFVDRENRIILEYKAKNSYKVEYLGPDGNGFLFRVRDGFGKYVAGQTVRVTASGAYLAEAAPAEPQTLFAKAVNFLDEFISVKAAYAADLSKAYVTDGQGRFWVRLDPSAPSPVTVTVQAGDNSQTFTLSGGGSGGSGGITLTPTNGPAFTGGQSSTASVLARVLDASGNPVPDGTVVTWLVTAASNNSPAMASGWGTKKTGLAWGATPVSSTGAGAWARVTAELAASTTTAVTGGNGETTVQLTDIVGERTVTVQASAPGISPATASVDFGAGPLSMFAASPTSTTYLFSTASPITGATTNFPAANYCGGSISYVADGHYTSSNLPSLTQFRTIIVDQYDDGYGGNGAWGAAGWGDTGIVWTDEVKDGGQNAGIIRWSGYGTGLIVNVGQSVVCLR